MNLSLFPQILAHDDQGGDKELEMPGRTIPFKVRGALIIALMLMVSKYNRGIKQT